MHYIFQPTCYYFPWLFRKTYLYLMVAMLGSLDAMPLHAKSKRKSSIDTIDYSQETAQPLNGRPKAKAVKNSSKKQPTSLVNPYEKKKPKQETFVKEQMGELFRSTAQLGLSAGLIFGLHQLGNKPFELASLVAPLLSNLATDPLKAIGRSCAMLFFPFLSSPRLNEAVDLKKQYQARKHTLSASMQSFTERILSEHIWLIQRFDVCHQPYVEVIKEVLQFPLGPKQVVPDTVAINQFMSNYPAQVRLAIGEFTATIVEGAKSHTLTKKSTPLMFVGPPGTGKTYLAKQLADLLQLPVQCIDVSKYKNVYGAHFSSSDPEKGVIAEALIGAPNQTQNWSNKILILDEIDKALAMDENGGFVSKNGSEVYSLLHALLEAQEIAIPLSRYGNACPDISQIKIILIANKTFTETLTADRAAALESRIKIIRFDQGFTPSKKQTIAAAYVDGLLTKKGIDRTLFNQDVINAIIAEDVHLDLKGIRVLLSVIDQYIDTLKHRQLINEISGIQITDFDVKQAYAPYHPKEAAPLVQSKKLPNKNA